VHIQVTTGRRLTSSQTGTSSTTASSDMRPPRLAGRLRSGESEAGMEGGAVAMVNGNTQKVNEYPRPACSHQLVTQSEVLAPRRTGGAEGLSWGGC